VHIAAKTKAINGQVRRLPGLSAARS